MSVEEKAVQHVADCGVMVPMVATTAEAHEMLFKEVVAMYLAGHAEGVKDALRWHTFDEAPPLNVQVLVLNEAYNSVKLQTFRHADTLYKPGYRMLWQEIGPLPSVAQSEASEAL